MQCRNGIVPQWHIALPTKEHEVRSMHHNYCQTRPLLKMILCCCSVLCGICLVHICTYENCSRTLQTRSPWNCWQTSAYKLISCHRSKGIWCSWNWIRVLLFSTGPLEYILNTPSHHRVHHGRNPYCIDKNYAAVLIIWDRMFGKCQ